MLSRVSFVCLRAHSLNTQPFSLSSALFVSLTRSLATSTSTTRTKTAIKPKTTSKTTTLKVRATTKSPSASASASSASATKSNDKAKPKSRIAAAAGEKEKEKVKEKEKEKKKRGKGKGKGKIKAKSKPSSQEKKKEARLKKRQQKVARALLVKALAKLKTSAQKSSRVRRVPNALNLFVKDKFAEFANSPAASKAATPRERNSENLTALVKQFQALSQDQKNIYVSRSSVLRSAELVRSRSYEFAPSVKVPKRPLTAYALFISDYVKEHTGSTPPKDKFKDAAKAWKSIDAGSKSRFQALASKNLSDYQASKLAFVRALREKANEDVAQKLTAQAKSS